MKKAVSLLLGTVLALNVTFINSLATSSTPENQIDSINITQEVIDQYGTTVVDENGNEYIEILLGTGGEIVASDEIESPLPPSDDSEFCNEFHGNNTRHWSNIAHTHSVINVSSYVYNTYKPVTQWAQGGFTVSKTYSQGVSITSGLSLNGGISTDIVNASLGISAGATHTRGQSESYSATVPAGYKGRISYRYDIKCYNFTNRTTYSQNWNVWSDDSACYAEGAPYNGYFYLQLQKN